MKDKSLELLTSQEVRVVIGYEKGTKCSTRPSFFFLPEDIERMVFDEECKNNLAVYLTKENIKNYGRLAIIANDKTLQSIVKLISENQIREDNLFVLTPGSEDGQVIVLNSIEEIKSFVNKSIPSQKEPDSVDELVARIRKMSREERWKYWQDEFARCIRCY
ncbi:MAG: hypothetical protein Q8908_16350, partial [Bacteroidota bacterium]|nr:hypothetical protein [Bacteroidota bacterium]